MDNRAVQIEPLEVVTVRHKHSFSVDICEVRIVESVMFSVDFLVENGNCIYESAVVVNNLPKELKTATMAQNHLDLVLDAVDSMSLVVADSHIPDLDSVPIEDY